MLTFLTSFLDGDPEDDRRDSDCSDCCDSLQKELWKLFSRAPSRARAVLTSGREWTAEVETAQVVTCWTSRCGTVIGQNKSRVFDFNHVSSLFVIELLILGGKCQSPGSDLQSCDLQDQDRLPGGVTSVVVVVCGGNNITLKQLETRKGQLGLT
uniref:Uncharacterized protein n=1 Tax=Branchiostoma floridae TaxID=7739 RepID=C3ZL70_BRAFL|eukprot:XP_002590741.1 hypothetical protein BRAFLDRAFT_78155 [Branchiostoma floridae]